MKIKLEKMETKENEKCITERKRDLMAVWRSYTSVGTNEKLNWMNLRMAKSFRDKQKLPKLQMLLMK